MLHKSTSPNAGVVSDWPTRTATLNHEKEQAENLPDLHDGAYPRRKSDAQAQIRAHKVWNPECVKLTLYTPGAGRSSTW